jgi:hypothetical protein
MQRAAYKRSVAVCDPIVPTATTLAPGNLAKDASSPSGRDEQPTTDVVLSSSGTFVHPNAAVVDGKAEHGRLLAIAIRQRIESRLVGRIRQLAVRIVGDTVVLEGNCSTYYSKQLAQHAALGVLESEHLENAIVVG